MSGRFTAPVALAADPAYPGASSAPQVLAVSPLSSETPAPAERPARRPAVRLEDLGDVLTDRDLAALLQVSARWPEVQRREAAKVQRAPNLPATIPGIRQPRYRRQDVAHWLRTGRSAAPVVAHRRVS